MQETQFELRIRRVQKAAEGRWFDILLGAGIPQPMLQRVNRPCPLCGGRDRFSFFRDRLDGHWYCRGCGYGDGLSLLQKWRGEGFVETLAYLERVLGLPELKSNVGEAFSRNAEVEDAKRLQRQARLQTIWEESEELSGLPPSDPVKRYLSSRGIYGKRVAELRSHPLLDYWEELDDGEMSHERWPAMIARVTDEKGEMQGERLHI